MLRDVRQLDSAADVGAQWLHAHWDGSPAGTEIAAALQPQYSARIYQPARAAYESVKGSGRFSLIRNEGLRIRIGALYETQQREEQAVNQLVANSLLELHRALRPYVTFSTDFPAVCCASAVSLAVPWPQVRRDRVLRNTLLTSEMFRRLSAARLNAFEATLMDLDRAITKELDDR